MDVLFFGKKLLQALIQPPGGLLIVAACGLMLLSRRPRLGRWLLVIALTALATLSAPFVASVLVRGVSLERPNSDEIVTAQAIVVLAGGVRTATPEFGDTVSEETLERVRYAAALARRYRLPILVSGGSGSGGTAAAQVMARTLREEFGVDVQWLESRSRDTRENALFSQPILRRAGITRVLLVTHDIHQRRSVAEFRRVGLEPVPMAVTTLSAPRLTWRAVLPSADALDISSDVAHEVLGIMAMAFRGGAERPEEPQGQADETEQTRERQEHAKAAK